jgi:ribosome-binding protein aMBF1 (putative translation factor)
MNDTFAVRLMRAQAAAGLCTYALAKKAGINKAVLYQLEHGNFNPSFKTLVSLARALNVSLDWLCCLTDERRPLKVES